MIRTEERLRLCITLLALNLAFIWGNSLLPRAASAALSDWAGNMLALFVTGNAEQGIMEEGDLLRKFAHATEFACLGMCLRWLFGMLTRKTVCSLVLPMLFGVLAAFVDEGIQMFVPGRGPGLQDVGIDTLGLALGVAILSIIHVAKKSKILEENKQ